MPVKCLSRIVKAVAVVIVAALPVVSSAKAETHSQVAQANPKGQPQGTAAQTQAPAGNQEIEGQIADLRRRLKITAAQQAQFDALAQVMRQNAQEMNKLVAQQPKGGNPSAVDAVRAGQQFTQAEAEGLGRMLPPLEALYGTLSDQQKRAADKVFASGASGPEAEQPAKHR